MDTALKLQLDVKNNAQELQKYMLDLNNWEEEMKRKELSLMNEKPNESIIPPPRNKIKRSKPENEKKQCTKPKKISAYDYSAWDKYDVEKALADIDKEDEENEEAEFEENPKIIGNNKCDDGETKLSEKFSLVDEAFYEKEMGNQFVRKEQWADAIKCYTNAINLDSNNAVYYANRSLCFLKLKNFKSAETDATTAIQLDKKYVKAYQRRAYARQILGQLTDAKSDFVEILKLEPKNALARVELNKINEKLKKEQDKAFKKQTESSFNPKNMFNTNDTKLSTTQSVDTNIIETSAPKMSHSSKCVTSHPKPRSKISTKSNTETQKMDMNESINVENKGKTIERGDGDKIISTEFTKQKFDVFKPLPEWCKIIQPINLPPHKRSKKPLKRIHITITDKEQDFDEVVETKNECFNVVEKAEEKIVFCKKYEEELNNERLLFDIPKTAIQFYNCWKILRRNPQNSYSYLKKIPVSELPHIFENSLESDFFSEIVTFLANDEVEKEPEFIYNFLWGLSQVKRFSSLILFMSEPDRKCVRKAISETEKVKSVKEISELLRLYEFKA